MKAGTVTSGYPTAIDDGLSMVFAALDTARRRVEDAARDLPPELGPEALLALVSLAHAVGECAGYFQCIGHEHILKGHVERMREIRAMRRERTHTGTEAAR